MVIDSGRAASITQKQIPQPRCGFRDDSLRLSFRVGVAGENREGAIELLGEHHASQLVGKSERRKRDFRGGAPGQSVGEAFGRAAEKGHLARAAVAAAPSQRANCSELYSLPAASRRTTVAPAAISSSAERGGRILAQLLHFQLGEAADACGVVVEQGADFRAARLAEHEQPDEHDRGQERPSAAKAASILQLYVTAEAATHKNPLFVTVRNYCRP